MASIKRMTTALLEGIALLLAFAPVGYGTEGNLELKEATFFGGYGRQGSVIAQGMGMAIHANHLYFCGTDIYTMPFGSQALLGTFSLPPGTSPVWTLLWPKAPPPIRGDAQNEVFGGLTVTAEGIYVAGASRSQTIDDGDWYEPKSVLVKFPLDGPTGPDVGGARWVAKPNFFTAKGWEHFLDAAAAQEGDALAIYVTGSAQTSRMNGGTAILAKYDANGNLLWARMLGNTGWWMKSEGDDVAVMDGAIYVSGYTYYPSFPPGRMLATLWKYDPAGNVVWMKSYDKPMAIVENRPYPPGPVSLTAHRGFLYVATGIKDGPNGGTDAVLLKYDQAGTLLWNTTWGGSAQDLGRGLAVDEVRLYVVGETASFGAGKLDAVVLEVDPSNGSILASEFYGGTEDDIAHRAEVVGTDLYVVGETFSFPTPSWTQDVMILQYRLNPTIPVSIDIKPNGVQNSINPNSHGKIPVAILSAADFLAPVQVDKTSLTFGRTGDERSLVFCRSGDEDDDEDEDDEEDGGDVNGDGLADLICHFRTPQTGFRAGDTQGILKGRTISGVLLQGADSVRIVPSRAHDEDDDDHPVRGGTAHPAGGLFLPKPKR